MDSNISLKKEYALNNLILMLVCLLFHLFVKDSSAKSPISKSKVIQVYSLEALMLLKLPVINSQYLFLLMLHLAGHMELNLIMVSSLLVIHQITGLLKTLGVHLGENKVTSDRFAPGNTRGLAKGFSHNKIYNKYVV